MRPEKETRIDGQFEGWSPTSIYRLGDGSRWRLARARFSGSQTVRYRPAARLWKYERKFYLEIVDTGEFAEVFQLL